MVTLVKLSIARLRDAYTDHFVILSQLSILCDEYQQLGVLLGNSTLANLSEQIYEHWKACDELMAVHYSKVQPYVAGWIDSLPRCDRKNFTPEEQKGRAIAAAHKAMAERSARETADAANADHQG